MDLQRHHLTARALAIGCGIPVAGSRSRDLLSTGGNNNGPGSIDIPALGAYFGTDPLTGQNLYKQGTLPNNFPNLNDFLPYQNYTGITLIGHLDYSNYNAFIMTWQKQAGRVTFTANYSFSKNMGIRDGQTSNGNGDGQAVWPYSVGANYGVLAYDRTQVFNAAYVINLPNAVHGKGNRLLGGVGNGWILSGITQLQSGPPLSQIPPALSTSHGQPVCSPRTIWAQTPRSVLCRY